MVRQCVAHGLGDMVLWSGNVLLIVGGVRSAGSGDVLLVVGAVRSAGLGDAQLTAWGIWCPGWAMCYLQLEVLGQWGRVMRSSRSDLFS
jgi:hypothetical protein